jgi:hypothetical protein
VAKERSMNLEEKLKHLQEKIKQNPLTSVTILIIVLLLLLIVVPYWDVNYRGINNATQEVTLENQSRATLAQILGGIVVGAGIYFAWGNLTTAREGQITERFTRAVDQLGATDKDDNPAIEIRLGGIYALERIANESEKDYWPIMEILTAYVRKNSPYELIEFKIDLGNSKYEIVNQFQFDVYWMTKKNRDLNEYYKAILEEHSKIKPRIDVEAIIIIIKKLRKEPILHEDEDYHLNLEVCNIQGVDLNNIYLEKTSFIASSLLCTNFENTHLEGANFSKADLTSISFVNSFLQKANFQDTCLDLADFREAHLKGAKNLTYKQLSKAKTLYKTELDPELEKELRAKGYSHLLEDEPKR